MFDSTPIENMFLLEYLPTAPEGFLRVYLYARMLCLHPELGGEIEDVARALHMDEDSVYNAFHYWEQQGLVEKLSDRPATYAIRPLRTGMAVQTQADKDYYKYRQYNSSLQDIFGTAELLEPRHYKIANDWLNVLGYTQEAALKLLAYEKSLPGGKKPASVFRRADKRAIEWAERGIHTLEEVEKAIAYDDQVYSTANAVMQQLGIVRKPSVNELDCVRRWINEWKLEKQEILSACVHTTKSRNPSIAYLDAILKDQVGGGSEHFEALKGILIELGAANAKPTPQQLKRYSELLDQGFEPEAIMIAAVQNARKNKHRFEDMEGMLEKWDRMGVHTHAQAEKFVADMQQATAEMRALLEESGSSRRPTMDDLDRLGIWKQKHSMDLIRYAAQCARGKAKPVLYMEKLLSEWEKAGAATPEAAKALPGPAVAGTAAGSMDYQQHAYTESSYGKSSYGDPTKDLE